MNQENQYLKDRIAFLEAMIDLQTDTINKALETNRILINYLKDKEE